MNINQLYKKRALIEMARMLAKLICVCLALSKGTGCSYSCFFSLIHPFTLSFSFSPPLSFLPLSECFSSMTTLLACLNLIHSSHCGAFLVCCFLKLKSRHFSHSVKVQNDSPEISLCLLQVHICIFLLDLNILSKS